MNESLLPTTLPNPLPILPISYQNHKSKRVPFASDSIDYPLTGAMYILEHRELWDVCLRSIITGLIATLMILTILFKTYLKPQTYLIHTITPYWFNTHWFEGFLIFIETVTLSNIIMRIALIKAQYELVYMILINEGAWDDKRMNLKQVNTRTCPSFIVIIKVLTLPVNLIPGIGTVLYVCINAVFGGWGHMFPYYDFLDIPFNVQRSVVLKGSVNSDFDFNNVDFEYIKESVASINSNLDQHINSLTDKDEITTNTTKFYSNFTRNEHVRFGIVSVTLGLIPGLGPTVFALGSAVGGGLWACDIEFRGRDMVVKEGKGNE